MMAADIYSKAGADARFLPDTPAGMQKVAESAELSAAFVRFVNASTGEALPVGTVVTIYVDASALPALEIDDIRAEMGV